MGRNKPTYGYPINFLQVESVDFQRTTATIKLAVMQTKQELLNSFGIRERKIPWHLGAAIMDASKNFDFSFCQIHNKRHKFTPKPPVATSLETPVLEASSNLHEFTDIDHIETSTNNNINISGNPKLFIFMYFLGWFGKGQSIIVLFDFPCITFLNPSQIKPLTSQNNSSTVYLQVGFKTKIGSVILWADGCFNEADGPAITTKHTLLVTKGKKDLCGQEYKVISCLWMIATITNVKEPTKTLKKEIPTRKKLLSSQPTTSQAQTNPVFTDSPFLPIPYGIYYIPKTIIPFFNENNTIICTCTQLKVEVQTSVQTIPFVFITRNNTMYPFIPNPHLLSTLPFSVQWHCGAGVFTFAALEPGNHTIVVQTQNLETKCSILCSSCNRQHTPCDQVITVKC